MKKAEPFTLGGRTFRHIEQSTIEQDYWLMARATEAGLLDLKRDEHEDEQQFSLRLMRGLIRNGQGFRIIAGLILPVHWRDAGLEDEAVKPISEDNDGRSSLAQMVAALEDGDAKSRAQALDTEVKDIDWSPEMAERAARHFRKLTDPAEKQIVHGMLATAYMRFFQDGLILLRLSKSRSKQRKGREQPGHREQADHTETGQG